MARTVDALHTHTHIDSLVKKRGELIWASLLF